MRNSSKILKNSLKKLVNRFGREDFVSAILKNSPKEDITNTSLKDIADNHYLKKAKIDEVKITQAEKIIKESGFFDPIIVRAYQGKYEVVIGRVKYIAAKSLKLETIPVVVLHLSEEESLLCMLKEISDRKTMNIYELALICSHLKKDFDYKNKELADFLNQSSSQISNLLQILSLPEEILAEISMNRLSYGHAKAISRLPSNEVLAAVQKIQKEHLSVRETEELVRRAKVLLEDKKDSNDENDSSIVIEKIEIEKKDKRNELVNVEETKENNEAKDELTLVIKFKDKKALKDGLKKLNRMIKKEKCVIE